MKVVFEENPTHNIIELYPGNSMAIRFLDFIKTFEIFVFFFNKKFIDIFLIVTNKNIYV
jgi:hypothetical protein